MNSTNENKSPGKMEHSKELLREPWIAGDQGIYDANGSCVAIAFYHEQKERNEAVFARIVACVNFCAGVGNEDLNNLPPLSSYKVGMESKVIGLRSQLSEAQKKAEWFDKHSMAVITMGGKVRITAFTPNEAEALQSAKELRTLLASEGKE